MRRCLIALSIVLLLPGQSASAQEMSDRDLYLKSLNAAFQALRQYGTYDDRAELQRVNDIGYRIARESGFEAFPYPEYSEVFFGEKYRVLRGASFATRGIVSRTTFRNWDFPQRRQIFAGFRCARDAG